MMKPTSLFQSLTANTRQLFKREQEPLPPPVRLEDDDWRRIMMVIRDGEVSYIPIEESRIMIDSGDMSERIYQLQKKLNAVGEEFNALRIHFDMPYISTISKHNKANSEQTFEDFCSTYDIVKEDPDGKPAFEKWREAQERLERIEEDLKNEYL